jgi:hypothetical protein
MKEIGKSLQIKDSYNKIIVGDVPRDSVVSFDDLYENGKRKVDPNNIFEQQSFSTSQLSNRTRLFLLPKRSPYIAEPALDNMGFILSQDSEVASIDQLTPRELMAAFHSFYRVQQAYEEISPIARHVISTNFHLNPLFDRRLFKRKVHAQSIPDLHFHIFSFSNSELANIQTIPTSDLSKSLKDSMRDPMFQLLRDFIYETSILSRLTTHTSSFDNLELDENEGIKFIFDPSALSTATFYRDLQHLHTNYINLYNELSSLYTDQTNFDPSHMPMLFNPAVRRRNVLEFINRNRISSEAVRRKLLFLSEHLRSGENIQLDERVLLRGPAYTMYMTHDPHNNQRGLYIAPRIISIGNALSALGYYYEKELTIDEEWIQERNRRQILIGNYVSSY